MGSARQTRMREPGEVAPDFRLPALDGGLVSLREQLSSGPALLAFFKVSCPVCQLTLPILERIAEGILGQRGHGLAIFGISQDDAPDTREFNRHFGVAFPTLLDTAESGYPVSNAYGLSSVPSLFLVEPDGRISWALQGFSRQQIQALGERAGVNPYRPGEQVPEWKAG